MSIIMFHTISRILYQSARSRIYARATLRAQKPRAILQNLFIDLIAAISRQLINYLINYLI